MDTTSFEVRTGNAPAVAEITGRVEQALAGRGDGLAHIFVPHATAGLALMETGSGSERDLLERLDALLPRDVRYGHEHGSPGHGRDHLLPAFLPPALVLPVRGGRLQLGRWQSLVLVDTNVDNPVRTVQVTFLPA
ncbi:MAG TPA: YjbQ family protein [Dehalococcoidia bacterium]|nr:YjbQ family protein [Dehalococcoidia bacterium]